MPRALAPAAAFVLRRHPIGVLAALLAAAVAVPGSTPFALLALVGLYGTAVHRPRRVTAAAGAAVVASVAAHGVIWGADGGVVEAVAMAALAIGVAGAGVAVAERRGATAREHVLLAERAAAQERLRIARELHDAVGHDVSLMVVQAQALGATARETEVTEATDAIAALGRRAMSEMHSTLRLLRDDGPAALLPRPGLGALDEVLDGARAAGVPVTITMEGAPRPLAPALDACAFRIVQEAVTNVVRHAGGAPATVTVRYRPAELELLVIDTGGATPVDPTPGHGLVGMRERAALFGGTLTAGARNGHGFEVRAVLPYPEDRG